MVLTIVRIWGKDKDRIGWVPGGIAVAVGKCMWLLLYFQDDCLTTLQACIIFLLSRSHER